MSPEIYFKVATDVEYRLVWDKYLKGNRPHRAHSSAWISSLFQRRKKSATARNKASIGKLSCPCSSTIETYAFLPCLRSSATPFISSIVHIRPRKQGTRYRWSPFLLCHDTLWTVQERTTAKEGDPHRDMSIPNLTLRGWGQWSQMSVEVFLGRRHRFFFLSSSTLSLLRGSTWQYSQSSVDVGGQSSWREREEKSEENVRSL